MIYHTYVTYLVSVKESDPTCDKRQISFTSQYHSLRVLSIFLAIRQIVKIAIDV